MSVHSRKCPGERPGCLWRTSSAGVCSTSRGGDTGSNPVGAATEEQVKSTCFWRYCAKWWSLVCPLPIYLPRAGPLPRWLRSEVAADGRSLRQRGEDTWQLPVRVGTDPITERKRYVSRTFHGTKRQAGRALDALVHETGRFVLARTASRPSPGSSRSGSSTRPRACRRRQSSSTAATSGRVIVPALGAVLVVPGGAVGVAAHNPAA